MTRGQSVLQFPFSHAFNISAKTDTLLNCLIFIPVLIVPFSPFLSFFLALFLMIIFGVNMQGWHRMFLSVVVMFAGAVVSGDCVPHSDFLNYYATYERLLANDISAIFEYGNGVEFALPLLFFVLGKIFGSLSASHFMALVIFVAAMLVYVWLECYGLKQVAQRQKAICVALTLMCFDFWFASWLERQVFSSIMILYVITAKRQESRFAFILLAIFFHVSALIFIIIIWLLVRYPKIGIALCALICGGYVFFYEIVLAFSHIPHTLLFESMRTKLFFYINGGADEGGISVRSIVFSLVLIFCAWFYVDKTQSKWRYVIIGLAIIYACSALVSNHLSLRIGVLFFFVALGYFFFLSLRKQPLLLYSFSLLYLVDLSFNMGIARGSEDPTRLFFTNDIIGPFFYYLF